MALPKYRITAEPPGKNLTGVYYNDKGEREVIFLMLEPESEVEIDQFPPGVRFLPSNSMFPLNDEAKARFKERDDLAIAAAKADDPNTDIEELKKRLKPLHSKSTREEFGDGRFPKVTPPPEPKPPPVKPVGGVVVSGAPSKRASDQ